MWKLNGNFAINIERKSEISELHKLFQERKWKSRFTNQCPDNFGEVHAPKKRIDHEEAHITSIPNEIFKDLHQLRVLNLSKNGIEFIDEHAFKGVAETLQTLDLSDNRIKSVHKNAFNNLKARARIANNPWHCDCTLQQVLRSMASNHETANNVICKTSVLDEHAGRPFLNAANDADLCNLPKKTTDYAMLVTMFGWFTMVISYVVYYVRQNQEDARRHLEYLKSLPSRQKKPDEADDISTVHCVLSVSTTVEKPEEDQVRDIIYTYYTVAETQESTLWNNSTPMLPEDQVEKNKKTDRTTTADNPTRTKPLTLGHEGAVICDLGKTGQYCLFVEGQLTQKTGKDHCIHDFACGVELTSNVPKDHLPIAQGMRPGFFSNAEKVQYQPENKTQLFEAHPLCSHYQAELYRELYRYYLEPLRITRLFNAH
ncbi:hypothetical protein IHE44_0000400 [Lamprotornis superbus]|uniref:Uncharacterized protein n=1 Tax=Lamprotornis superbus TaxID=245042 RepID=A0A835NSF9_9PASS|nr:hypothetical protein IHE44_0000400 [Lamprotornis superbus]